MANRIVLNNVSYHGKGAIENVPAELTAHGVKKAFVCADPDLLKFGVAQKVTALLDQAGIPYDVFSEIKANPTIQNVQAGVAAFQASGADGIVAIGGGSAREGQTREIDEHAVRMARKEKPRFLFLPTASRDEEAYIAFIDAYFCGRWTWA